jgi:hypothetical protein
MNRFFYIILLIVAVNLLTTKAAEACTPIVELALIFGGYNIMLFFIIIPLKCAAFPFFEKRLDKVKLIIYMLIANIFSSFMGLIMAVPFTTPELLFGFMPVFVIMAYLPAKRLTARFKWKYLTPSLLTIGLTLAIIVTIVLFAIAKEYLGERIIGSYWLFKILYIIVGISISIVLTIVWEEKVIAWLAKKTLKEEVYFLGSVTRANLISLLIVAFFAAMVTIPERLSSEGFLLIR